MTNKEFIFSVKKSIQESLNISLEELSKKTKIKTQRLKSIIYQNDNIYINDLFSIARALNLRIEFDLGDDYTVCEDELLYWDFEKYNNLKNQFLLKAENSSNSSDKEYYLSRRNILLKNEKSFNMLRFLLCSRIEKQMRILELSSSEMATLLNVTDYYFIGLINGEENFPLSLLFKVTSILNLDCIIKFEALIKANAIIEAWHIHYTVVRI